MIREAGPSASVSGRNRTISALLSFVPGGMMGAALEREKLVDGCDRGRVGGPDPHLGAARTVDLPVTNCGTPSRHHGCARHHLGMHLERPGEVSRFEGG